MRSDGFRPMSGVSTADGQTVVTDMPQSLSYTQMAVPKALEKALVAEYIEMVGYGR